MKLEQIFPHRSYFEQTENSSVYRIDRIFPREEPKTERLRNALRFMDEAKRGKREKRSPLLLRYNSEKNRYQIVDGNTTLHALKILGEEYADVEFE